MALRKTRGSCKKRKREGKKTPTGFIAGVAVMANYWCEAENSTFIIISNSSSSCKWLKMQKRTRTTRKKKQTKVGVKVLLFLRSIHPSCIYKLDSDTLGPITMGTAKDDTQAPLFSFRTHPKTPLEEATCRFLSNHSRPGEDSICCSSSLHPPPPPIRHLPPTMILSSDGTIPRILRVYFTRPS